MPKRDYMATLHDSTREGELQGQWQGQQSAGAHWFLCVVICFGLRRGDLNGSCKLPHELRMLCKYIEELS